MALTNYRKGADKERRIVNKFREQDCIAFRSAGSHSPIDVLVIDWKNKDIKFIQVKTNLSERQKKKLEDKYFFLNGAYSGKYEVWD